MNSIPSNPFQKQPISKIGLLSGRTKELNDLDYCFKLTASGQSNHCAMIGARAVGKSSLLICSAELAKTHKLVYVRIDLTQEKVKRVDCLWKEIYSAACLAAAMSGCWDGAASPRFDEVLQSIRGVHGNNYFQLPRFWNGGSDEFGSIPDLAVKHDFAAISHELRSNELSGMVIFIDEADLLTIDVTLLQSLRNVFQDIQGVSLVLAGTENLFEHIVDIFSPIPRQFHRIDVEPFPHWSEIYDLIDKAIQDPKSPYRPEFETIFELHKATGGEPAEIQLYCHTMYKEIEQGRSDKMKLNSNVYRSVFSAYRKQSNADAKRILQKLEELSKNFIPACLWLQNAALDVTENTALEIAIRELEDGHYLPEPEKEAVAKAVEDSYKHLFRLGISSDDKILKLTDAGCLRGLWKSIVVLETGDAWQWKDGCFNTLLIDRLHDIVKAKTAAFSSTEIFGSHSVFDKLASGTEEENIEALKVISAAIRTIVQDFHSLNFSTADSNADNLIQNVDTFRQTLEILRLLTEAYNSGKKNVVRIPITFEKASITSEHILAYFDSSDPNDELQQINQFLQERSSILASEEISFAVGKPSLVQIPDFNRLQNLMNKVGIRIDIQDKTELERACELFGEGNVSECTNILRTILNAKETPARMNNLAFSLIHQNEIKEARTLLEGAIKAELQPLFINNLAIVEFLSNNFHLATDLLHSAWNNLAPHHWSQQILFMNVVGNAPSEPILVMRDIPTGVGVAYSMLNAKLISHSKFIETVTAQSNINPNVLDYLNLNSITIWRNRTAETTMLGHSEED